MTLDLEELVAELEKNRQSIDEWIKKSDEATALLLENIDLLDEPDADKLAELQYPGARPLEPGPLVKQYERTWEDREGALDWVDKVLSGRTVAAVDGSQIYPPKEMFLSIGVVQAGLVLNRHGDSDYENITQVKLLSPSDLGQEDMLPKHRNEMVDALRFKLECETLIPVIRDNEGVTGFLDGPLVLSHIQSIKKQAGEEYLDGITALLGIEQASRSRLCGYVDLSKSTDLCSLLSNLLGNGKRPRVWDVQLLRGRMLWGDRTKAFVCDRDDRQGTQQSALDRYDDFRDAIGFFYMQLNSNSPVRVEFPVLEYTKGDLDDLADMVRAEVLIKGDYPDILYRAHNLAVIKEREKQVFLRMVRGLLADNIGVSSKEIYKSVGGL
jgi:hypothetical protein